MNVRRGTTVGLFPMNCDKNAPGNIMVVMDDSIMFPMSHLLFLSFPLTSMFSPFSSGPENSSRNRKMINSQKKEYFSREKGVWLSAKAGQTQQPYSAISFCTWSWLSFQLINSELNSILCKIVRPCEILISISSGLLPQFRYQ